MAELKFDSNTFLLEEHESVLDCLLRNQQAIPYACKAGTCQACLIKTVDCDATPESTKWIKQTLQAQGYTLACQWVPPVESKIAARLPAIEEFSVKVSIKALDQLNARTLRLRLSVDEKEEMFHYTPGQYLTLINPDGISRSYSIANNYENDQFVELHISQTRHGVFTQWLFEQAAVGDELHIRGPAGDCFYVSPMSIGGEDNNSFPLLLAGVGTGLAPLYGIIQDALSQGHKGPISLFQGALTTPQLYYVAELKALQQDYPNFHYFPVVLEETDNDSDIDIGNLEEILIQRLEQDRLPQTKVYLCGGPDFVHGLRKKIFLKGAKSSNIFCDPFIERVIKQD